MTHSPALERYLAAVRSGDDASAEALVADLRPGDEPELLAMALVEEADQTDLRWWSVRALAEIGSGEAAAKAIAYAFAAPEGMLRAAAALALGRFAQRLPEVATPQIQRLANLLADDDGFVRQAATHGLALCGTAALPALESVLQDEEHEGARSRAASALRTMRSVDAAPLLFCFLGDENALVRTYCHEALDELGLLTNILLRP